MENNSIYKDIAKRTGGDIYIGVVGPVRCGKSTFIQKFLETVVIPNIENEYDKARAEDETPQSAAGKTIMTTEPKFVPDEAVKIKLEGGEELNVKLIDSVGYLVDGAMGAFEDGEERMIKTPWSEEAMPFKKAAEIGTKKVIDEHSTIAILVTTDGSVAGIPRESYIEAEERIARELHESKKPFARSVKAACAHFGVKPSEVAVIGDQIFTDVWCARNAGALAILVKPIPYPENLFFKCKRVLEKPFIRAYKKKH